MRVFISHNAEHDHVVASLIAERLHAEGYTSTFLSADVVGGIRPGLEWEREIYEEMRQCDLLIYISTSNSAKSKWCFAEVVLARSLSKPIIPIQCAEGEPDPLLNDTQWINYFREGDAAFIRLWNALRNWALSALPEWDIQRDPYPGLSAFEAEDAAVFFGRGEDIERLLSCFRHGLDDKPQTVLVIGPSGCGKSSLVRAGLLPRLSRLSKSWAVARPLTPQESLGQGLLPMLARQVAAAVDAPLKWKYVLRLISERPDGLITALHDLRAEQGLPDVKVLLTVDQLEELVTVDKIPAEERVAFANVIDASTYPGSPIWTVATLRAEFLTALLQEPSMAPFTKNQVLLAPLDPTKFRQVIEGPAKLAHISFEDGLVDEMARDTPDADALPLLAYALQQLHINSIDRKPFRLVTRSDYRGLGEGAHSVGGIEGILVTCADQSMEALSEKYQAIALRTLLRFVNLDGHDEPTRRLVRRSDLDSDESRVITPFVERRLLTTKRSSDGVAYVDVAHEALFRVWTPLAEKIGAERSALRLRYDVERLATAWDAAGRHPSYCLIGDRLLAAEHMIQAGYLALDEDNIIADFLRESRRNDEAARTRFIDQIEERIAGHLDEDPELSILLAIAAADELGKHGATWLGLNTTVDSSRLRGVLAGHTAPLLSVAFSPDGRLIATSSEDGTARVWSVEGVHKRTIDQHDGLVGSANFSPDSLRLLTASADGKACIWDVGTGFCLQTLIGHIGRVRHAVYSPDGQAVVTSGEDGTVRLWSAADGSQTAVLKGHEDGALVLACAFSPDGNQLVSTSSDHSAVVWEQHRPGDWRQRLVLKGHEDWVRAPSFSPDGSLIATASEDGTTRLYHTSDGSLYRVIMGHRGRVRGTSWSPNGKRLLTASGDGTARIWSTDSFEEILSLRGHGDRLRDASFAPSGDVVATASEDGFARLWTVVEEFPELVLLAGEERIRRASFSGPGDRFAVALNDGRIQVWDIGTRELLTEIHAHQGRASSALVSPDCTRLYSSGWDGTVRIWNPASGSPVAIMASFDSEVRWLDLSPDGKLAAAALSDGTVQILCSRDGHIVGCLSGHDGRVLESRFSPDGSKVVSSGADHTVRVWDLENFHEIACLRGHSDWVRSACFSPDGSLIASAGEDAAVVLWDVATVSEIRRFLGHEDWVRSVSFSPDGDRLLTCSGDRAVRVWMVSTGGCCHLINGHKAMVVSAEYSASGEKVLTASYDGTVRLWNDLPYEALTDLARSRVFRELSADEKEAYGLGQWSVADDVPSAESAGDEVN